MHIEPPQVIYQHGEIMVTDTNMTTILGELEIEMHPVGIIRPLLTSH